MKSPRKLANPLALAVLVLLFEKPMHPYEMAATLRQRGKEQSIKLRYGSLYTVIRQLERESFIESAGTERAGGRPERTTYRLTDAGEAEMNSWLRSLVSEPVKEYPQFEAALTLLPALPPPDAQALLTERLGHLDGKERQIQSELEEAATMKLPALFLMSPARYYHPVFFRFMMPRIVGGRTARDPAALAAQIDARLSRPPDLLGYVHQLYAASGWTSAHYLHQLSQPALVLAGDDDRAIPLANARFLAWRIPNARLHVIECGGHALLLDQPEAVVGVMEDFLDAA